MDERTRAVFRAAVDVIRIYRKVFGEQLQYDLPLNLDDGLKSALDDLYKAMDAYVKREPE